MLVLLFNLLNKSKNLIKVQNFFQKNHPSGLAVYFCCKKNPDDLHGSLNDHKMSKLPIVKIFNMYMEYGPPKVRSQNYYTEFKIWRGNMISKEFWF